MRFSSNPWRKMQMATACVEIDRTNFRRGQTVRGRATIGIRDRFSGRTEILWEDSHGRILWRVEKKARFPGKQILPFSFTLDKNPMTRVNKVVVQVTDDLLVRRCRTESRFTITPPRFAWDDFEVILWGSKQEWATEQYVEQLKQTGVTAGMAYAVKPGRIRRDTNWLADGDMNFYVENCCQIGWDGKLWRNFVDEFVNKAYAKGIREVPDKQYLVRKPCMNDPAYWAEAKRRLQDEVRARDEYGPMAYDIGDEQSIALFTTPYDFCFSRHCLREFRAWLKKVYGTVGRLNESWDSSFRSWDDVQPLTREEIRQGMRRSFAPWADHRDFMDTQFAKLVDRFVGYVREVAPGACVGIEGTQKPSVYGGFDYWKLMNTSMNFHEIYDIGGSHRIATSFNRNGCVMLGLNGVDQDNRSETWQKVFHGNRGVVIWWLPAFTNADGTVREPAKGQKALWNEVTGGISKLLDPERSVHDWVAIHYSPASIRGHWITMKELPVSGDHEIANAMDLERLGVMRLVEDLGFTYRFAASAQIEDGELDNYKALVLPGSLAVSDKEAGRIREFVRRGGMLIADYQVGLMDEHCAWRATGVLDDVFGVSRDSFCTESFETSTFKSGGSYWYEKMPPLDARGIIIDRNVESLSTMSTRLYYPTVDSGLETRTGIAMGHEGKNPAVIVNRYGRGLAVYMNLRLLYYTNHRLSRTDQVYAQTTVNFMRSLFGLAGIKPAVAVQGPVGIERVMFEDGAAEYHCLRRNMEKDHQAGLGEVVGGEGEKGKPIGLSVKFGKRGHVYELRTGRYLGVTDSVSGKLEHPEPLIYSVLPYKVDDVDIEAGLEYRRGEKVRAVIRLHTRKKVKFADHVVRCRLYGPDTLERTAVRKNVVTRTGRAAFEFDLALNEMAGEWRIVARDVATGVEREHKFTVQRPPE
ncbi:MAG: hypothetical protein C0404_01190 [Verrucomicrobia bacterium]|nr:hypothetical protein [Verrucomicrobiota bacterium]